MSFDDREQDSGNWFQKYGFGMLPDGTIQGPVKPKLYGIRPEIRTTSFLHTSLEPWREYLRGIFLSDAIVGRDIDALHKVLSGIFFAVTGGQLDDYTHIRYLSTKDWESYQRIAIAHGKSNADEGKSFHAINLGGLILINCETLNAAIPLLLHEIGHSLYVPTSRLVDELRAYFFQRVATRCLSEYLRDIGLEVEYPELSEEDFPSVDHQRAYHLATELESAVEMGDLTTRVASTPVELTLQEAFEQVFTK